MLLNISHRTSYQYERPVNYGLQQLRLVPKSRQEQEVISWNMEIEGGKPEVEYLDHHMNHVTMVSLEPDTTQIVVTSHGVVDTKNFNGIIGRHGGFTPLWYFLRPTDLTHAGQRTRHMLKGLTQEHEGTLDRLHALSARVLDAITYETGETLVTTTAEDALANGRGVCQDHTHVFLAAARVLGIPARYVSGYLQTESSAIHAASHAWVEAHVEGLGWIGFDVANGISPDDRYVRVATGRDYTGAAPIFGLSFGDHGTESLSVAIQVQQ